MSVSAAAAETQQPPATQKARPYSFSESHIQLPRILSNQKPLLLSIPTQAHSVDEPADTLGLSWDLPSVNSRTNLSSLNTPPKRDTDPEPPPPRSHTIHLWAIRFTFHLLLISAFETLFFWKYVAPSEDTALTGLVNTYTSAAFGTCSAMTPTELNLTVSLFNALVNTTTTLQNAQAAAAARTADNNALYRNSWLYFGALMTAFGILSSTAHLRRLPLHWGHILGENLALVTFLGLYEWMFFHTVAFQYRAVSPAELDGLVVTEFTAAC
jgi:hypothetical protein